MYTNNNIILKQIIVFAYWSFSVMGTRPENTPSIGPITLHNTTKMKSEPNEICLVPKIVQHKK